MTSYHVDREILSQPEAWSEAAALAARVSSALPAQGERVAIVGCGTSWFIAMSAAVLRERAGHGETDAFAASEFPSSRRYDRVIAISRSGTTTEVVDLLSRTATPTTLITAVPLSPAGEVADEVVGMPFADERSVVQTRFATSVLALLRAHLGEDLTDVIADARRALAEDVQPLLAADQCTFVATGWGVGLTNEAALKTREAAQFWSESYPAMDYRHGPIAIAQPGRLVWSLDSAPDGLQAEVESTGASFIHHGLDPLAALIVAQRFAVALATSRGLDPDHPRSLTRSVILS